MALGPPERFEAVVSVCGGSYEAQEMVRLKRVQGERGRQRLVRCREPVRKRRMRPNWRAS